MGTVTGMIDVFFAMSSGAGDEMRSVAHGVGRATIPAMAGMVGALTGLGAKNLLQQARSYQQQQILKQLSVY
jgi:biopolymer transport protein ExbB